MSGKRSGESRGHGHEHKHGSTNEHFKRALTSATSFWSFFFSVSSRLIVGRSWSCACSARSVLRMEKATSDS